MSYLALEILAYLLAALGLGVGAGWLLRNLTAQRREAELGRERGQARQRLEKLQARASGGEERCQALQAQVRDREARLSALLEALKSQEELLAQKDQRIGELETRLEAEAPAAEGPAVDEPSDAAAAADAAGQPSREGGAGVRVAALEAELARLERALEAERRRVAELQRERTLQLNTLKALHQQLEMARERADRAPADARSAAGSPGAQRSREDALRNSAAAAKE